MCLRVHVRRLRDTALSALELLKKVVASVNFQLEISSEDIQANLIIVYQIVVQAIVGCIDKKR